MTRFMVVRQWQGSPSVRAMALADGAEALSGDLPRAATAHVEVPAEAGESLATGVRRASSLIKVRRAVREALITETDRVILIGGDCSITLSGIEHVAGDDLAVVWFDAHPDLNEPSSSPSGAFAGMAARAVLGDGVDALALPAGTVTPDRLLIAGARAFDDAEAAFAQAAKISMTSPAALATPDALVAAVRGSGATRIYIHVDLDVLDPAAITGVHEPVPFGITAAQLVGAIAALRTSFELVGATIAGFAPRTPSAAVDDLGTILRVVGALSA